MRGKGLLTESKRKDAQIEVATSPGVIGQPQHPQDLSTQLAKELVRGNGTNCKTQHEESARTEVARKMCGFFGNIWDKEPPTSVDIRRPERKESPVGSI